MGHSKSQYETAKDGDGVVFAGNGNIIIRDGRGHVMLFCSDGKKQICIKLSTKQADSLIMLLERSLYPQLHTPISE